MLAELLDSVMVLAGTLAGSATAEASPQMVVNNDQPLIRHADELIPLVAIGGGLLVAIVAITFGTLTGVAKRRAFEESRRELAAYVAEGTMSPQDAERILKTGKNIG